MQPHPHFAHAAWIREREASHEQMQREAGRRLAGWLVIGNTGALVLVLQVALDDATQRTTALAPVAWLFVLGLISAFVGRAINYWAALGAGAVLAKQVDVSNAREYALYELAAAKGSNDDDAVARWKKHLAETDQKYRSIKDDKPGLLVGTSMCVLGMSALFFASAVCVAVWHIPSLALACRV